VWPLFTGWAAVAEYRYHRPLPAYANLRANALLALNGAAGHATEVLSGDYFEPLSTSSPHQIWSSAMIISPLLRGMLGLETDAIHHRIKLVPHVPADWTWWKAAPIRLGTAAYDLAYSSDADTISLSITPHQAQAGTLDFSPSISPIAKVTAVEVNGSKAQYSVEKYSTDQHVLVHVPLERAATVRIRIRNNFALAVPGDLPALGATSQNLKVVNESWDVAEATVVYELAGVSGREYILPVHGAARIARVEGAKLIQTSDGPALRVQLPPGQAGYQHIRVAIQLSRAH
jgi:hypothetical protein